MFRTRRIIARLNSTAPIPGQPSIRGHRWRRFLPGSLQLRTFQFNVGLSLGVLISSEEVGISV